MTKDKVIRREVYLNEGDVFNTDSLKQSIRRINQLGYFKPMEGVPQLSQNAKADDKLDVTFKLEEQNRNQFTFGAGVSGLEGFFINASFQTSNFLGLGETFALSAQSGKRTTNYQLAITEPYLFDRPITAGFDLYKRRLEYQTFESQHIQGYVDDRVGLSLISGLPVGRWSRAFINYSYEIVTIETSADATQDPLLTTISTTATNPFFVEDLGTRHESKLTPSIVYNSVDNPWTPRSGFKLSAVGQLAGGPLGGNVSYFKPNLEAIAYIPHWKLTALGLRAEAGWVIPFGNTAEVDPKTGRTRLPFYQRFRLGGETQIRGYNVTTVGPRDAAGNAIGGTKFMLFNAEYYIDIAGPLRGVLFFDAGQAFLEDEPMDFGKLRTSTGVELRFIMPVLNVPFRLVYAWNLHRDDFQPATRFGFFIGTTF
jgi:outer membrane protein insertion porin family